MTRRGRPVCGMVIMLLLGLVLLSGRPDAGSATTAETIEAAGPERPVTSGPSVVAVSGRRLMVQTRRPDGTLAPAAPYIIRGVVWAPASRDTDTSPTDPRNAEVRRQEFANWFQIDIPLMAAMHVNTVRLVIDLGVGATHAPMGWMILDAFYRHGIMVIMTVDDGINDLARVQQAVKTYKDHPAILMWGLGNEWNLNLYFGVASSVADAVQRTEAAAALIKALDPHHPVSTSYGDIDLAADGLRLADTQRSVQVAPSVDVWGLNVYRGRTFGTLFEQWISITHKPMFLGEFGTDAFASTALTMPPPGRVDEAAQAAWNRSLWHDLFRHLSAHDASRIALGGTVMAWVDEWWKVPPAGSQQTGGLILKGAHPDDFANEEYFGIVDIDRRPRQVYATLQMVFARTLEPGASPWAQE